jgi:hypothetical protein
MTESKKTDPSGIHWVVPVKELDFDSEGRIVIRNPQLTARIKEDMRSGKHLFIMAANSDEWCVHISSCICLDNT